MEGGQPSISIIRAGFASANGFSQRSRLRDDGKSFRQPDCGPGYSLHA